MRGGIGVGDIAIESAADDLAFVHRYGADRYFSDVERTLGSAQGLLHPQFIVFSASSVSHDQYCMRLIELSALTQMDGPVSGVNGHQISAAVEFTADLVLLELAFGHDRQIEINMSVASLQSHIGCKI